MGNFRSFEELECWKEARLLRNFIKDEVIPKIAKSEKYGLISQIQRSSRSVGNNIAEGYGRYHFQENVQFCRIARGSLEETLDHIIIATDEGYISEEQNIEFRKKHRKALLILNGYIKYLKSQKSK